MKTPHKCPVCDGEGRREGRPPIDRNALAVDCKPCDGKGVLWDDDGAGLPLLYRQESYPMSTPTWWYRPFYVTPNTCGEWKNTPPEQNFTNTANDPDITGCRIIS